MRQYVQPLNQPERARSCHNQFRNTRVLALTITWAALAPTTWKLEDVLVDCFGTAARPEGATHLALTNTLGRCEQNHVAVVSVD
jgi:hypothetical protein